MGYIYVEFDERPHAKIKAKEYYKECMRLALENGYTKEFYWLKRAREYLAKVAYEKLKNMIINQFLARR